MYFCRRCGNFSQENICGYCGAKRLRPAEDNDPVFLAELSFTYSGMLEGALQNNEIPFIKRERYGGIMKYVGWLPFEENKFFVPLCVYEKAKEILSALFDDTTLRLYINKRFKPATRKKSPKPHRNQNK